MLQKTVTRRAQMHKQTAERPRHKSIAHPYVFPLDQRSRLHPRETSTARVGALTHPNTEILNQPRPINSYYNLTNQISLHN
jgi:hypothetical protein